MVSTSAEKRIVIGLTLACLVLTSAAAAGSQNTRCLQADISRAPFCQWLAGPGAPTHAYAGLHRPVQEHLLLLGRERPAGGRKLVQKRDFGLAGLEQATGLGRQSLYGAFGDKRALFTRVIDHYFEAVLKPGFVDVLDAPGSARANLERIFEQWQLVATMPEFNGCLLGNSANALGLGEPEFADFLRRKLKLLEDAFARALRRAQDAGEVAAALDPRATARSLLAISQGLAVIGRVQRDRVFIRGVVDSARRLLD